MREHGGLLVANSLDLLHRYQGVFARKPMTGFNNQLANRPSLGVYHEIADMADRFFPHPDEVTVHGLRAAQMHFRLRLRPDELGAVTLPIGLPPVILVIFLFVLS